MEEKVKVTKGNLWGIPPKDIVVIDGYNSRQDFGDIDELASQIKEQGVLNPITVQAFKDENGNEKYHLIDGERRYRAVMKLISDGVEIVRIPAIQVPKNLKQEDLLIQQAMRNEGKKFNEYEWAIFVQKLMQVTGYTKIEVARKIGKTPAQITQWLSLLNIDNEELRDAVKNNEVNGDVVRRMLQVNNNDEDKTLDEINEAKKNAAKKGKNKVTLSDVKGDIIVHKHTQDIKKGIELILLYEKEYREKNNGILSQVTMSFLNTILSQIKKGNLIDNIFDEMGNGDIANYGVAM